MKHIWTNFNAVRNAEVGHFPPISSLPEKELHEPLPKRFTLLVWNIYKRLGGEQFDHDLANLDSRSHISCLQEVLAKKEPDLPTAITSQYLHYGVSYRRQDGWFEGILSASRYNMLEDCVAIKSIGREPLTKTPKTALITYLKMEEGQTLLVVNVHMLLFKSVWLFRQELKQILSDCKKDRHLPAVFCGDFNTFLPWHLTLLDKILYRDGFYRCKPKHRPRGSRYLDHVYVRGLKLIEMQIVDRVFSSDHFPLLCELELN